MTRPAAWSEHAGLLKASSMIRLFFLVMPDLGRIVTDDIKCWRKGEATRESQKNALPGRV